MGEDDVQVLLLQPLHPGEPDTTWEDSGIYPSKITGKGGEKREH